MRSLCRTALCAGFAGFSLLLASGTAQAAETAASEIVIITEGSTVSDDLYAAGVRIIIEGTVEGDLVAFGAEEVVISGEVTGSVLAIAPTVTVSGRIGESARVSSSRLTISGSIDGDLVAAALNVDLDSGSEVAGDVLVWAVEMNAAGTIGADLEGTQRTLALAGSVEGDVDVSVNRLTVTGPLDVTGDLGYRSPSEAEGLDQATVGGVVVRKTPVAPNIRVRALGLLARVLVVLGLTSSSILVAWGWPQRTSLAGDRARSQTLRSFGYGALIMLSPLLLTGIGVLIASLVPASASLPLLAIFGPLVLATAGIVLILSLVAGVPAVLAIGRALPRERGLYGAILAGAVVAGIIWLIPYVGWVVPLLVLPIGLGAWMLSFRESREPGDQPT
jgi:cytoskeletal protein CcmA (bactofilin family)